MKQQYLSRVLALICVVLCAACSPQTVSGTYIHSSPTEVAMLQLVEGEDGSVSGSLQTATANANHRVNVDSVALSGRIDGTTLTLSTPTILGMGTTFSGARSGDEITLTFTSNGRLNTIPFHRSTPDTFANLTEQLRQTQALQAEARAQAQAAAAERASDAQMRTAIPALSGEFEQTAANDVTMTARVDAASARFASLTQQARDAAAARQRERDGVRHSQLSVYINQVSIETNGLNMEVESAQRQFADHRTTLAQRLEHARAWCARTNDGVCARLEAASARYTAASSDLIKAFDRANVAYRRAETEQAQLAD